MDLRVTDRLSIPGSELVWRFDTSGGPGGQHANRSATRVTVVFNVRDSSALDGEQKARILTTQPEQIAVTVDSSRSQWRNRQLARQRLADLLRTALTPPPPPRRRTKPGRAARERRLSEKRKRSETKERRRRPEWG